PLARRMAREAGLDIAQVRGTGPGGRVVKRDIEAYLAQRQAPPPSAGDRPAAAPQAAIDEDAPKRSVTPPPVPGLDYREQELGMMRKTIARRMVHSKTTAPHFYITTAIDMEQAIA